MQLINADMFFSLGSTLRDCKENVRSPVKMWYASAMMGVASLERLVAGGGAYSLNEASKPAERMLRQLELVVEQFKNEDNLTLSAQRQKEVVAAFNTFTEAMAIELSRAPIFYVTKKGIFDTMSLLNSADAVYVGWSDRLPQEARDDTKEAGRCLAFDLFTACGFHLARATEAVIKRYMESYGCTPPKDSQRNWGVYTTALTDKGADKLVVNQLDQLRLLHRNPITHPEKTLTQSEALSLQAMCQSLIQAMVGDMEKKRADPDPIIAAMLPTYDMASVAATMAIRLGMGPTDEGPFESAGPRVP